MTEAQDRRDDEVLAAEYALHLLDPDERAAFEDRLNGSPALFALVRAWDEDFTGMANGFVETAPPGRVKKVLERRLFSDGSKRRFSIFEMIFGGVAAAAVAFALFTALPLLTPTPEAEYAANIAAEDGSFAVAAAYDADTGTLELARGAGGAPEGRVLELWLIAEGATAPVSLGVIPEGARVTLAAAEDLRPSIPGGTLAISEEPPGGAPGGAPTGQILGVGPVTEL